MEEKTNSYFNLTIEEPMNLIGTIEVY